jgi:uridine kinase
MKICIIICGLKRCVDLVINNLDNILFEYDIEYITCLSNNELEKIDKNYINKADLTILDRPNIIKKIFIRDIHDNSFRNSLNYARKISDAVKIVDQSSNYDLYMIIRTDLIIGSFDFINAINNIENDILYFSNKNINQFSANEPNRINDNIIITKSYDLLYNFSKLYDYAINHTNYLDVVLYNFMNFSNTNNYIKNNNQNLSIPYKLIDIPYKLILSRCNIIAIAGDSGSGKSTLLKALGPLFNDHNILSLETDRYHKWERGNENYQTYSHLNPYANHLEKMYEDVYDLKIGNDIYQVDYDHHTGKFTSKEEIKSRDNILICGLHTLYDNKMKELVDIKIYVDTDRELLKKWKIQRDVTERGYSMEKVLAQISAREKDYEKHILVQKEKSDIIINFYEDHGIIRCNLIINNTFFSNKILKDMVELKYIIKFEEERLIIPLKNNICIENNIINNIFEDESNKDIFKSYYYKEIFYVVYLISL